MDWIKVKTVHILYEYKDLLDAEFVAWIKLMALTAHLDHMPTREQMLSVAHYKTIDSLEKKFNKRSIDIQYVLNKVLIDVQYVLNRRETWKNNKQQYRAFNKNVSKDVSMDVSTQDKIRVREDKNNIKHKPQKIAFEVPEWINKETWAAYREMRTRKRAPLTDRAASLVVKELEKLKGQGHDPERVLNQSIMKSWTGVFPISDGGGNDGRRTPGREERPGVQYKEYTGDALPEISDEERQRNLEKLRQHGFIKD